MNEHHDSHDLDVEQKTMRFERRITLLETCNAILHNRLVRTEIKVVTLEQQLAMATVLDKIVG